MRPSVSCLTHAKTTYHCNRNVTNASGENRISYRYNHSGPWVQHGQGGVCSQGGGGPWVENDQEEPVTMERVYLVEQWQTVQRCLVFGFRRHTLDLWLKLGLTLPPFSDLGKSRMQRELAEPNEMSYKMIGSDGSRPRIRLHPGW